MQSKDLTEDLLAQARELSEIRGDGGGRQNGAVRLLVGHD